MTTSQFPAVIDIAALDGTNGFEIAGASPGDLAGWAVNEAGDVNGDGLDDLVVGAPGLHTSKYIAAGAAYVLFGASGNLFPANLDVSTLNGTNGFSIV